MNVFDEVLDKNKEYFHALSVKPVCIGSQSTHKDFEFLVASGPNVPPKIHNFWKELCSMCQVNITILIMKSMETNYFGWMACVIEYVPTEIYVSPCYYQFTDSENPRN